MPIITGSNASDELTGRAAADTINALSGDDLLFGMDGNDRLVGGTGLDFLSGGNGNDNLRGGADSDNFEGGAGIDFIDGGSTFAIGGVDRDRVAYNSAAVAVAVNLATGTATDGLSGTDTLVDIEEAIGSNFNDSLIGGNAANNDYEYFEGGGGNDTINGGAGIDWASYFSDFGFGIGLERIGIVANLLTGVVRDGTGGTDRLIGIECLEATRFSDDLRGGGGADSLLPSFGSDAIDGSGGFDTVAYVTDYRIGLRLGLLRREGIDADLRRGTVTDLGDRIDTVRRIENVTGSEGDDEIKGTDAANTLDGFDGDDLIGCRSGNDRGLGGEGEDRIAGNGGADILNGQSGDDTLNGGAGADRFVFEKEGDYDIVRDFDSGIDRLDVTDFDFATRAAALAAAAQRGASVIVTLDADTTVELGNTTLAQLTAADFIV